MQKSTLTKLLGTLLVLAILTAMAPVALSDMGHGMRDPDRGDLHHGHEMMVRADMPITVTGIQDGSAMFTIGSISMEGKKGVAVMTFDQPLLGAYNMSNDMAYISTKGVDIVSGGGMTIRVGSANNTTLPVAGTSAVMSIGDIRVNYWSKDYTFAEFSKLSIYLPDGTVRKYDLEKPVKVIKSKERQMVIWDAYPGFTNALKATLQGNQTFSADAAPLKLSDLLSARASSTPSRLGDTKPMEASSPT